MNKLLASLIGAICIMSCIGCSSVARYKTADSNAIAFSPTVPENIQIFTEANIEKEYNVIGLVVACADAGENANVPIKLLKKQAALLGADAVLGVTFEFDYGGWDVAIKANGIAIKLKEGVKP